MSLKATLKIRNKYVHEVAIVVLASKVTVLECMLSLYACCRDNQLDNCPPIPFYLPKKYSGFLFMHLMIRSVSVGHA